MLHGGDLLLVQSLLQQAVAAGQRMLQLLLAGDGLQLQLGMHMCLLRLHILPDLLVLICVSEQL